MTTITDAVLQDRAVMASMTAQHYQDGNLTLERHDELLERIRRGEYDLRWCQASPDCTQPVPAGDSVCEVHGA